MAKRGDKRKTIVGGVDPGILAFTVGKDRQLDLAVAEDDCIGTAAHVSMLARLPLKPPLFTSRQRDAVVAELVAVMRRARSGALAITEKDQDIHLAVERLLTGKLGDLGRRVHTARSRNDQIALDLRLYARRRILDVMDECAALAAELLRFAKRHELVPMVGRTHFRPAMPSSVGVWASAYAEGLLNDFVLLKGAYEYNDRCPLGSAAGYGVPLEIDRALTARLLGFGAMHGNVLNASLERGKCESVVLGAMAQVMLTLSRLAEDLVIYAAPEFGYFRLPAEYGTGSSIMPQKNNPDVMELVRARSVRVQGCASTVMSIVNRLPGGYNRDLQETKEPFLEGFALTLSCLDVTRRVVQSLQIDRKALLAGFSPDVYAADRALELVGQGMSFRKAYAHVRTHLDELELLDADQAVAAKKHAGAPAGLDFDAFRTRVRAVGTFAKKQRRGYYKTVSALLGTAYPGLD